MTGESFESLQCPSPLRDYPTIILGHGGGGRLTQELLEEIFLPAFGNPILNQREDAAVLDIPAHRLAFTTDSYVVHPLFFPGGCIGDLAVYGTVNDLATRGARPLALSAAFILEEGLQIETLRSIVQAMAEAARRVGVPIITGDTKVVEKGHGDGCYINTSGIGEVRTGVELGSHFVSPGDAILINGTIGDHGMAILSRREGMEFESPIVSDTAPLHEFVATLLDACPDARCLRDPTRGGVITSLHEIARSARVGMELFENTLPIQGVVQSACDLLGLDPLAVANEGKMLAIVPDSQVSRALRAMKSHPLGGAAAQIGRVVEDARMRVVMNTRFGTARMIPMPLGEQLPRIC